MKAIRIENMTSPRTGKPVANQITIQTADGVYFQSYQTVIAFKPISGRIVLDEESWDYSRTTDKYRNQFLGESKEETERKIQDGTYILDNLN